MLPKPYIIKTPIGNLGIICTKTKISRIIFTHKKAHYQKPKNKIIHLAKYEITKYFTDPHYKIKLSLDLDGTPFQKKVWGVISQIPPGQTKTYGEIAQKLKTCAQAIGQACKANKLPIVIPCHRVVNKNKIGGYCGETILDLIIRKKQLLLHEKATTLWEI